MGSAVPCSGSTPGGMSMSVVILAFPPVSPITGRDVRSDLLQSRAKRLGVDAQHARKLLPRDVGAVLQFLDDALLRLASRPLLDLAQVEWRTVDRGGHRRAGWRLGAVASLENVARQIGEAHRIVGQHDGR